MIRGKGIKDPVLRTIATDKNGDDFKCNSEQTMIPEIKSNRIRPQQCIDTLFITKPLVNLFGYLANEQNLKRVINGRFISLEGTNSYAVEFLDTLRMPRLIKALEKVGLEVTSAINATGWKRQEEKTASAYGTIGFNHFKTSSLDPTLNKIDTFTRNV